MKILSVRTWISKRADYLSALFLLVAAGPCLGATWEGTDNFCSGISTTKWQIVPKSQGQMTVVGANCQANFIDSTATTTAEQNAYILWKGTPTAADDWMVEIGGHNSALYSNDGGSQLQLAVASTASLSTSVQGYRIALDQNASGLQFDVAQWSNGQTLTRAAKSTTTTDCQLRLVYHSATQQIEAWYEDPTVPGSGWTLLDAINLAQFAPSRKESSTFTFGILSDTYYGPLSEGDIWANNFNAGLPADEPFSVTISSSPAGGGTTTGGGTYTNGQSVTVIADPAGCYEFSKWTEGGKTVSTDASYTFTLTNNVALVAEFIQIPYTVTAVASPANGGSASGGGIKDCGSEVTLTAHANSGFKFVNWTEGTAVVTDAASYKFTASKDVELTANFENTVPPTLTLTSPTGNETTTSNALHVIGKAKDNETVTGVYYNISGSGWFSAQNNGGWTNWSFTAPLALGTNVIQIYAQDSANFHSAIKTITVVRKYKPNITIFPIDSMGDVTESKVQCAFDGNDYLVVYQTSGGNVGQFVSPSGGLLGGQLVLDGGGDPPAVAFDGTNYLTAWESYSGQGTSSISGTFVGRDGAVGNPGQLVQSTTVDNYWSIVFGGGVYFLTWVDSGGNTSNQYLDGAMISPSGKETAGDFIISKAGFQPEAGQAATAFDGTNFLTTWAGTEGGLSLNGRLVSPAGDFVTDPFVIYTNSASATHLAMCATFDGTKYLVLFTVLTSTKTPATWHIQGRFVTTTGQVLGKDINLTTDTGPQVVPGAAFDGTNYLLTWSQGYNPSSASAAENSVKAGVFDVDGNPLSSEFTLFGPQDDRGAICAPVLFDGIRFCSVAALGNSNLNLTNGIISGAFILP